MVESQVLEQIDARAASRSPGTFGRSGILIFLSSWPPPPPYHSQHTHFLQYEAFARYRVSREVPCFVIKFEMLLGTLDATPKVEPRSPALQADSLPTELSVNFNIIVTVLARLK